MSGLFGGSKKKQELPPVVAPASTQPTLIAPDAPQKQLNNSLGRADQANLQSIQARTQLEGLGGPKRKLGF